MKKRDLKDLIRHTALHSNYRDGGYIQMTTEQKALYDRVLDRPLPHFYGDFDKNQKSRYDKVRGL